ncbi:Lrp/AsnC family transcriptional regulator [Erythrobacter insulae]|nr:Lrp/AsnC family transcriptional regulator [Erythrobacter insulae]
MMFDGSIALFQQNVLAYIGEYMTNFVINECFKKENLQMDLDSFDLAILDIVQRDNQRSHGSIGTEVNLSASAVRRRLSAMRNAGIIVADVALIDPARRGLTFITSVTFDREDIQAYENFEKTMLAEPAVAQCYSVSGDYDFILLVFAETPAAYAAWGKRVLMPNPAIGRYSTAIVWSQVKFSTVVQPADETYP